MKTQNIFFRKSNKEKINFMLKNVFVNFIKIFNNFDMDREGNIIDIESDTIIITLTNSGESDYNQVYYENGIKNGFMSYLAENGYRIEYNGAQWLFFNDLGAFKYYSDQDIPLEDLTIIYTNGGFLPVPTINKSYEIIQENSIIVFPELILKSDNINFTQNLKYFDKETTINLNQYFNNFSAFILDRDENKNILDEDYLIQINYSENIKKIKNSGEVVEDKLYF